MKIDELPLVKSLASDDALIASSTTAAATRRVPLADFYSYVDNYEESFLTTSAAYLNNASKHRARFRGKNLGSSYTSAQKTAISSGKFTDLYVGDYWKINGYTWRIMDIDYWYGSPGSPYRCATHHVVVVPDEMIDTGYFNETTTTEGGYQSSYLHNYGLATSKTKINNAFGSSYILSLYRRWSNAVPTSGTFSGVEQYSGWYACTVECMSIAHVVGDLWEIAKAWNGNWGNNQSCDAYQFAGFLHAPELRWINKANSASSTLSYWLCQVMGTNVCAAVNPGHHITKSPVVGINGIRPCFALKG